MGDPLSGFGPVAETVTLRDSQGRVLVLKAKDCLLVTGDVDARDILALILTSHPEALLGALLAIMQEQVPEVVVPALLGSLRALQAGPIAATGFRRDADGWHQGLPHEHDDT